MTTFENNLKEILTFLNKLSDERCQILFGNSQRFENLLREHGINNNNVRI